jgi:hypothetical protein
MLELARIVCIAAFPLVAVLAYSDILEDLLWG